MELLCSIFESGLKTGDKQQSSTLKSNMLFFPADIYILDVHISDISPCLCLALSTNSAKSLKSMQKETSVLSLFFPHLCCCFTSYSCTDTLTHCLSLLMGGVLLNDR